MKYFIVFLISFALVLPGHAQSPYGIKKVNMTGKPFQDDSLPAVATDNLHQRNHKAGRCIFAFDNATGYFIDIWIENDYVGRLSPYSGTIEFDAASGLATKWHARNIGKTMMWNNKSYCNENRTFVLHDKPGE